MGIYRRIRYALHQPSVDHGWGWLNTVRYVFTGCSGPLSTCWLCGRHGGKYPNGARAPLRSLKDFMGGSKVIDWKAINSETLNGDD